MSGPYAVTSAPCLDREEWIPVHLMERCEECEGHLCRGCYDDHAVNNGCDVPDGGLER